MPTRSGRTARLVSAIRPKVPVLAVSPRIETVRRLNLLFGVQCATIGGLGDLRSCSTSARSPPARRASPSPGDLIGITAGLPDQELGTNLFEVHRVP